MREYVLGDYRIAISEEIAQEAGVGINPEGTELFVQSGLARLRLLLDGRLSVKGSGGLAYDWAGKTLRLSFLDSLEQE